MTESGTNAAFDRPRQRTTRRLRGVPDRRPVFVVRAHPQVQDIVFGYLTLGLRKIEAVHLGTGLWISTDSGAEAWRWIVRMVQLIASSDGGGKSPPSRAADGRSAVVICTDAAAVCSMAPPADAGLRWRTGRGAPYSQPGRFWGTLSGPKRMSLAVCSLGNWHPKGMHANRVTLDDAASFVVAMRRLIAEHDLGPKLESGVSKQAWRACRNTWRRNGTGGIAFHQDPALIRLEADAMKQSPGPVRKCANTAAGEPIPTLYQLDLNAAYASAMYYNAYPGWLYCAHADPERRSYDADPLPAEMWPEPAALAAEGLCVIADAEFDGQRRVVTSLRFSEYGHMGRVWRYAAYHPTWCMRPVAEHLFGLRAAAKALDAERRLTGSDMAAVGPWAKLLDVCTWGFPARKNRTWALTGREYDEWLWAEILDGHETIESNTMPDLDIGPDGDYEAGVWTRPSAVGMEEELDPWRPRHDVSFALGAWTLDAVALRIAALRAEAGEGNARYVHTDAVWSTQPWGELWHTCQHDSMGGWKLSAHSDVELADYHVTVAGDVYAQPGVPLHADTLRYAWPPPCEWPFPLAVGVAAAVQTGTEELEDIDWSDYYDHQNE